MNINELNKKISKYKLEIDKMEKEILDKTPKVEFKIFEGTVGSALKECLKEGYFPATRKQINQLLIDNKISRDKWYISSTADFGYEFRNLTLKELENIENYYKKSILSGGARLLFVDGNDNGFGVYGNGNLDVNGRFVGVAPEANKGIKGVK